MQIYEPILEYLRMIGLTWNQSAQNNPFNGRNLFSLFIYGLNLIGNFVYVFCGAKGVNNFIDALLATFTTICIFSIFISFVWKMQEIFEFFTKIDDIVTQSKRMYIFLKLFFIWFMWSCFVRHRTGKWNVASNLHGNRRNDSEMDTNFQVWFASAVTSLCGRAAIVD